jgi:hypothetical protein
MRSTGEVMGVGATFAEAYAKAQLGTGKGLPKSGRALLSVRGGDKKRAVELAAALINAGFELDFDWIKNELTNGLIRERHLAKALRIKAYEYCRNNPLDLRLQPEILFRSDLQRRFLSSVHPLHRGWI